MSASTDRDGPPAAAWLPVLLQAAVLLVGLAAGLWPQAIFPSKSPVGAGALPTLQALAVSHVIFVLLIWPLMLMRGADGEAVRPGRAIVTATVYVVVSAPLYVAAAWLGDAEPVDVIRTAVYVACLAPLGWAAGTYMAGGRAGSSWVLLAMLLLVAGVPAGHYIAREFLSGAGDAGWLWRLGPATGVWDVAAPAGRSLVPRCVWPLAVYFAAAAAISVAGMVLKRKGKKMA